MKILGIKIRFLILASLCIKNASVYFNGFHNKRSTNSKITSVPRAINWLITTKTNKTICSNNTLQLVTCIVQASTGSCIRRGRKYLHVHAKIILSDVLWSFVLFQCIELYCPNPSNIILIAWQHIYICHKYIMI